MLMGQVFSNIIQNCNCGSSANNEKYEKDSVQDKEIIRLHQSISEINIDIKIIKENHLHHMREDIIDIKTDVKIMSNNITILLSRSA